MISDNATNFISTSDELNRLFDAPEVKDYLVNKRVEWKFIPKRAPWFGGFWERLIGLTKNAIKKTLGRAYVTYDELNTLLTEVEAMLNDRPITYVSADVRDNIPLTPAHLLHGRPLTTLPYLSVDDDELTDPTYGNHDELNKLYTLLTTLHNAILASMGVGVFTSSTREP
ncbi:uncharacterized protein [Ptychodera flava]|uniref:uncharacterized protein n=1 Tax=Ptychodera flava TaxID=63121 RepID=UPI00396A877A